MRTSVVLILSLLVGCSSTPQRTEPSPQQGAAPPTHRLLDRLCFDDCMGENSGKEFCEDRCTY